MDRRRFLQVGIASGLALARSRVALAQQGAVKRLAFINTIPENDRAIPPFVAAMKEGLASEGWIEGKNIIIDIRYGADTPDKTATVVQELLGLKPDVFITVSVLGATELQKRAPSIPAVAAPTTEATLSTLVPNFSRPSGNITGITGGPSTLGKQMQLLKELVPSLKRVGTLYYPTDPPAAQQSVITAFTRAATDLSMEAVILRVDSISSIDPTLKEFAATPNSGFSSDNNIGSPFTVNNHSTITDALIRYHVPHALGHLVYGSDGLLNYYVDTFDIERRAGAYAGLILKGTPVSSLPVQTTPTYALVVNREVASQLGITVPQPVLFQATEIIQ